MTNTNHDLEALGLKHVSDETLPRYVRTAAKRWASTAAYVLRDGGCYQLMTRGDVAEYIANVKALES